MNTKKHFQKAFTIIELLVVITVIGILASLTIIAYNNVQQSARDKSVLSDLDALDGLETEYGQRSGGGGEPWYSASGPDANLDNFNPSAGNVIDIVLNNATPSLATEYCIRGYNPNSATYTSLAKAAVKESTPGVCSTISPSTAAQTDSPLPPPITNLAANPSVETNTTGLSGPNSTVVARDTSRAKIGVASLVATMPVANASQVGATIIYNLAVPTTLALGTQFTVSAYVYVPTGTVDIRLSIQGSGKQTVSYGPSSYTSVKDNWTRISQSFTTITSGSGTVTVYVLNNTATTVAGTQFWVDGVMLTAGPSLYNYADGSYTMAGWSWTGTANNSTSTGTPL